MQYLPYSINYRLSTILYARVTVTRESSLRRMFGNKSEISGVVRMVTTEGYILQRKEVVRHCLSFLQQMLVKHIVVFMQPTLIWNCFNCVNQ